MTVRSQAQISFAATEPVQRPTISEDWLAVMIAFAAIGLVLAGIRPAWPAFDWTTATDLAGRIFSAQNLGRSLTAGLMVGLLAASGAWLMRASLVRFAAGFGVLYAFTWLAQVIAGSTGVSAWGLEYVIFALLLGLLVSNVLSVPAWLREAARSEYYIKIGLVFLGASVLFADIMRAGLMGLAQAVLVVTAVWFVSFWVARRLGIDDELATMLSAAVSICGISAAIAACGAIQGDRKKLSYVTSLVLVVAVPMMVLMPHIVRTFGMPDAVGGAWLGGTLDTSASVVAAGELVSDTARDAGVVVKLSQNVLIGVAAFLLTIWWAMRNSLAPRNRVSAYLGAISEIRPGVSRRIVHRVVRSDSLRCQRNERAADGAANDAVRSGFYLNRARNAVRRPGDDRWRTSGGRIPDRSKLQSGVDAAAGVCLLRRDVLRHACL